MEYKIEEVLGGLLGADNQRRLQMEIYVNELPKRNFQKGIEMFLMEMGLAQQHPHEASMSALLLKKKYLDQGKETFSKISLEKLQFIVKFVRECMQPERPLMFLKRCCDILVKVYTYTEQQRELMELIQSIAQQSNLSTFKLAVMYLIEIICEFAFDDKLLVQFSATFDNIFQVGLNDENNEVRVASFKTLTVFLASMEDYNVLKKFEPVLQMLLKKAIDLIKYDQQSGTTAIQSINELIQAHPKFVKPIFKEILMVYTEIMEAKSLLVNLRIGAMYGVLLLAMNHSSLMRKSEYFATKMVPTYMSMLAENETISLEQWAQQLNEEIISKTDIALSTEEHLGQILNELGNKFMLPLFIKYIQMALTSNEATVQHAGLTAMAILTEGCHETYKKDLSNIVNMIIPLLQTENPRIVHDLLVTMGYMAEEFAPDFQKTYGDIVLQFINKSLSHPYPKVQFRAVQCIQNFETGMKIHEKDEKNRIMEKYLDTMLGELGKIFERSLSNFNCFMLEAVLDSIATIASTNNFAQYYVAFMPGLKKILTMIDGDTAQKSMIRSKTIETMGYLLSSVKDTKELFMPDCKEIMASLIQTTQNSTERDDPIHKAIYIVYENISDCLKQDFAPYAQQIYDRILQSLNRKVDFQVVNEGESEKETKSKNQYVKMKLDLKIEGLKNLVLNTDSLEQKIEASTLVATLAEDLGSAFGPYIEKTIPSISELISYNHNKQVRSSMIQTCKYMVQACVNDQQKIFVLNSVLPAMMRELSTVIRKKDHQETNEIVEVLAEIMPAMNEQMRAKMPEVLISVLASVKNLTKEIEKIYAEKEKDEVLDEQMEEQIQSVEEVLPEIQRMIKVGNSPHFEALRQHFPQQYEFETM